MSAHRLLQDLLQADFLVTDPGDAGDVVLAKGFGVLPLVTVAAETRTVPAPQNAGQRLLIVMDTDGGDCVVTITDGEGVSTVTLDDAGDWVLFEAAPVGGDLKWFRTGYNGLSGSDYTADGLKVGSVIVSPYKVVTLGMPLNSQCIDQTMFIADRAYELVAAYEIHSTAGNDAGSVVAQITKDTGTNAPGAGTALLTNNTNAGFNMKGTANTLQTGTLTATTADLQLAAGNRLGVNFTGTVTTLAGAHITAVLKPI